MIIIGATPPRYIAIHRCISISPGARGGTCPARESSLAPLDAADYLLRSHRHAPPLALPQQPVHAHVPTAASPHAAASTSTAVCARARARSCLLCSCLLCKGLESLGIFTQGWSRRRSRCERIGKTNLFPSPAAHAAFSCFGLLSLCGRHFSPPIRSTPRHASTHARAAHARTTDGERRDVRSAGVADWKTSKRGDTERTLTAQAGHPPCDPHRHIATPLQGGRPERPGLLFLRLLRTVSPDPQGPRSLYDKAPSRRRRSTRAR